MIGCGDSNDSAPSPDGGSKDGSTSQDGSVMDAGSDSGSPGDAGSDAGSVQDAGSDASLAMDGSTPSDSGTAMDGAMPGDAGSVADAATDAAVGCVDSACDPGDICVEGTCQPGKHVFLSSAAYDGNLGGLAGADAKCQSLADAAGLSGTYEAWLSDGTDSPDTRFSKATVPYVLPDGTIVANDWTDLTDGTLATNIAVDELGVTHTTMSVGGVFTATKTDGTASGGLDCSDWTDDTPGGGGSSRGAGGDYRHSDDGWTTFWNLVCGGDSVLFSRLYCFEQ